MKYLSCNTEEEEFTGSAKGGDGWVGDIHLYDIISWGKDDLI